MTLFDPDDQADTLTVGRLTQQIGQALKRRFPGEVWVQGQIRNLSRSARGHVYFDLIDPVPDGAQPTASIPVVLFDSSRQVVNRILTRAGNAVRMADGVEVRIRGSVTMYQPRGQAQLAMTSIDPEFTLGRLGADRERLLEVLRAETLIDANSRLTLALVPLRVGLVTSSGSAAEADFVRQLEASGYAFEILTFATRVQGEFAAEEIAAAIDRAGSTGPGRSCDVIAVVRGGGSRTDLAAFDAEGVARAIAAAPTPVVCGIGHEIDTSVADLVAHTSVKTPTACAQLLVDRVAAFDRSLDDRRRRLVELAAALPGVALAAIEGRAAGIRSRSDRGLNSAAERTERAAAALVHRGRTSVERADATLGATSHRLRARADLALRRADQDLVSATAALSSGSRIALASARRAGDRAAERLAALPARSIDAHRHRLDLAEVIVEANDPVRSLDRGWSITTTVDGTLVRDPHQVSPGELLHTRLSRGTVISRVTDSPDQQVEEPS